MKHTITTLPKPTPNQLKQFQDASKRADQGSCEKQMALLKKYPRELKKALELARI